MRKVITGNQAVSFGVMLSRVQVISAYPITPQTEVVEMLSSFCARGQFPAKFIKVESEHSAMAACIGASSTGVRTFTATSSQGLALMHELLHWAAGARLPIVMVNVNRAMAAPWTLWADQNDSLAQRDTGWLQFYCESAQEALDTIIQAYKVSEKVHVPSMVCLDGFYLSHTDEEVDIPEPEEVDAFLPPLEPAYKLDVTDPRSYGGVTGPEHYYEMRVALHRAHEQAKSVVAEVDAEFSQLFGRSYGLVSTYRIEGAELVIVTSGMIASTARVVVDECRNRGLPVGLLKIKNFRPFPTEEVRSALAEAGKVAVIDRNISFGSSGIFFAETKGALYSDPGGHRPPVFGFVTGLGGRDVTPELLEEIVSYALTHPGPKEEVIWIGMKEW
jgi:pyruvate/2-oxoacid:ferredoxin oxidoreductase alpha subunit